MWEWREVRSASSITGSARNGGYTDKRAVIIYEGGYGCNSFGRGAGLAAEDKALCAVSVSVLPRVVFLCSGFISCGTWLQLEVQRSQLAIGTTRLPVGLG